MTPQNILINVRQRRGEFNAQPSSLGCPGVSAAGAGVALELGCWSEWAARKLEKQLRRGGGWFWAGRGDVETTAGAEGTSGTRGFAYMELQCSGEELPDAGPSGTNKTVSISCVVETTVDARLLMLLSLRVPGKEPTRGALAPSSLRGGFKPVVVAGPLTLAILAGCGTTNHGQLRGALAPSSLRGGFNPGNLVRGGARLQLPRPSMVSFVTAHSARRGLGPT